MTIEAELDAARAVIREYASRIEQLTAEKHEPIAIVGMGLRMPGGSATMDAFAEYLDASRSAIGPIPSDRWNVGEFVEGDGKGNVASARGGFLTGIDQFDTSFFNISPKEAQLHRPTAAAGPGNVMGGAGERRTSIPPGCGMAMSGSISAPAAWTTRGKSAGSLSRTWRATSPAGC